jgi:energy-coupling factor transport system substrate-specific component
MPVRERRLLIRVGLFLAVAAGLLLFGVWKNTSLIARNWGLLAALILLAALVFLYLGFERRAVSAREIGVTAVLGAVAAAGRVAFAAIPGMQPATFVVIIAGFVFGPRTGFMVGATAAVISNFFLGQGPWTPCQMFAWGLAGITAGWLGILKPRVGRTEMVLFSFAWGYLFGWIMNLWFWAAFVRPLNWPSFLTTCAASFPFDTLHAAGNVIFTLLLGKTFYRMLMRFKRRMTVSVLPAPAAVPKDSDV